MLFLPVSRASLSRLFAYIHARFWACPTRKPPASLPPRSGSFYFSSFVEAQALRCPSAPVSNLSTAVIACRPRLLSSQSSRAQAALCPGLDRHPPQSGPQIFL